LLTELHLRQASPAAGAAQDKQLIRVAIAVSVLLHLLIGAVTWRLPLTPDISELPPRDTENDVEMIFEDIAEDEPSTYVSVPERQAVPEAPEDPDYLAVHHSIAADNKLGEAEKPSAAEDADFEKVEIRQEDLAGAGGVVFSPQPDPRQKPATSQRQKGAEQADQREAAGDKQADVGQLPTPAEETAGGGKTEQERNDQESVDQPDLEDWWGGRSEPSILKAGDEGVAGDRGFDFDQSASGATTSGVAIIDQFQLSTVEWDWGPWVQVFGNELHRHWVPPYAYRLGLINGTTVIRLVVEKDGRPSSLVVLDRQGHESLHEASVAALKAFAPYKPLPAQFPEENLVITLSLHYPAFRR